MAFLLALALLAQATPAAPPIAVQDPQAIAPPILVGENARLAAAMREYFAGEKREAWAWLGMGIMAAGTSAGLGASPSDVAQGASFPLIDIAVIQLGAAAWLLYRTDDQVARLETQLATSPCAFFDEEPARMHRVNRGFSIYLPIEATFLVGGGAMAGLGFTNKKDLLAGAGLGLVAQSVIMLIFDQFAAARAVTYDRELQLAVRENSSACGGAR